MTVPELTATYGSLEAVPHKELYDFICQPKTQRALAQLGSRGQTQFLKNRLVESVRKLIVTEPQFTAQMQARDRADLVALFFPEYATATGSGIL